MTPTIQINNGYTNVAKVYEENVEFGTGSNHKNRRKAGLILNDLYDTTCNDSQSVLKFSMRLPYHTSCSYSS